MLINAKKLLLIALILLLGLSGCANTTRDISEDTQETESEPTNSPAQNSNEQTTETNNTLDDPDKATNFAAENDSLFHAYTLSEQEKALFGEENNEAEDGLVAILTLPGIDQLGQSGPAGPTKGSHLESQERQDFGTFVARIRGASCHQENEGVVTGFFTYFNNGADDNQNGIIDNSEIDFEILCAEPHVLYMSVWTDYQANEQGETFHKVTRKVNLKTGKIWQTAPGDESSYDLSEMGELDFTIPDFDTSQKFYTIGFTWQSKSVRYFIIENSQEYELWNMTDDTSVPQRASYLMFNLWHNRWHWNGSGAADYPSKEVAAAVDWFKYYLP